MSPTIDIDDLREEHKEAVEWDINPVKHAVLELLQHELNDTAYRHLSKDDVLHIVEQKFAANHFLDEGREAVQAARLLRKMKRQVDRDAVILALGDYILQ